MGAFLVRKHCANWQHEKARLLLEWFAHPGGYPSHDIERERLDCALFVSVTRAFRIQVRSRLKILSCISCRQGNIEVDAPI